MSFLELPPQGRKPEEKALGPHLSLSDIYASRQLTDVEGVPVESDRMPGAEEIDFEYVPCPYQDSPARMQAGVDDPKPMSNLEKRRLTKSYPDIKRLLLATRQAVLDEVRGRNSEHIDVTTEEAHLILAGLHYLPDYLVLRYRNPLPLQRAVPMHIVVGSNAASGALGALGTYCNGDMSLPAPTGKEANEVVELQDPHTLVGDHNTVCAAAPAMIRNYISLIRDGAETPSPTLHRASGGLITRSDIMKVVAFGNQMEQFAHLLRSYTKIDAHFTQQLKVHRPGRPKAQIRPVVDELKSSLRAGHARGLGIENSANRELDRELIAPMSVTFKPDYNPWKLQSVKIAIAKGLI